MSPPEEFVSCRTRNRLLLATEKWIKNCDGAAEDEEDTLSCVKGMSSTLNVTGAYPVLADDADSVEPVTKPEDDDNPDAAD